MMQVLNRQPINEHHQPSIVQLEAYYFLPIAGKLKGTSFKTFVVKGVTTAHPVEQLQLIPVPVDE